MDVEKLLDSLTKDQLKEVLAGTLRRLVMDIKNGSIEVAVCGPDGTTVGRFLPAESDLDPDSPEALEELQRLEEFDGPTMSAEDSIRVLEFMIAEKSRTPVIKLPDSHPTAVNAVSGS